MAYFPLFNITDAVGFTTLANFSPNNREKPVKGDLFVTSLRTNGKVWRAHDEGIIEFNCFRKFEANQFDLKVQESESEIILLQMSDKRIDPELFNLQPDHLISTHVPEWRATVGFKRNCAQTSYQGEVNPFPNMASLLTFHPFIQVQETENYFVLLNVESSPVFRWSELEIYNSNTRKLIDVVNVRNNCVSIIPLDQYGFTDNDLPVFQCKSMAGIPFGFGKSKTASILSLEHTHPPGSLTLFGNRFSAQKHTKSRWSEFLKS